MRAVTPAFLAAVGSSHQMRSRVRTVAPGQHGTTPNGTEIPVLSGSVVFDSTAQVNGTATVVTGQAWPVNSGDLLAPFGNEVFIERGVVYGGGSVEWVSLGYYRINQIQQEDAPFSYVSLTCTDRMQGIVDARLPTPATFVAGSTVASIITALVTDCYPWAVCVLDASLSTATTQADQVTTDDRYGFLNNLVTSYGMIMYWDYKGQFVVKPAPNPNTPVSTISYGRNGMLVSMSRTMSRDQVYNAVVATAQAATADAPPSAVVVDNDPTSATYYFGPFGKVPEFYSSSFLTTTAQCISAAQSMLLKATGVPYEVDFGMVCNPALELWDPIIVDYPGKQENHVLRQMTIGLAASDSMTAQTRQLVKGNFAVVNQQ